MKPSTAIAALLVTTLGLAGLPATAMAEQAAPAAPPGHMQMPGPNGAHPMPMMLRAHMRDDGMRGGLLNLVCSRNGAERLDVAFTRLSYRIADLSAEQKALLDTLKARAIAAQTTFAETCQAAGPAPATQGAAPTPPDLVSRLKTRIAIDTARLDALNAILPDLEAFFNSLTDPQKAALQQAGRQALGRQALGRQALGRQAPGNQAHGRNDYGRWDRGQPGDDGLEYAP